MSANSMRKSLTIQKQSTVQEELFQFHAVAFLYLKKEKQWKELGEGPTKFMFEKETSSIVIKRGENVCHRVSLSTKVQSQVATSQSWVFRAVHYGTGSHDVLCLQLPDNPAGFVSGYETHRIKCMQLVEAAKNGGQSNPILARSNSSSSTASSSTLPTSENEENIGADLSNGFRSIILRSTMPMCTLATGVTPDSTASMRRRLSTVGNEYTIDGYAPGARHEERAVRSPTQKSPLRPSITGSAKSLRHAHASPTVLTFSGVSVKGIAPYNPDKQNQDSLVLHQLPTGEVVLSVFDGHGEEGKTVSNHFQKRIPKYLANCKLFAQPETTGQAIKEALERS
jgi:hypothetical protein